MSTALALHSGGRQKSALLTWYEGMKGGGQIVVRSAREHGKTMLLAAGRATRGTIESGTVGAALGFAAAELKGGLDVTVGKMKIPLDALAGGLGFFGRVLASAYMPALEPTADSLNKGGAAVYAFRTTEAYTAARRGTGAQVVANKTAAIAAHGEDGPGRDTLFQDSADPSIGAEDPLMKWAKGAGWGG